MKELAPVGGQTKAWGILTSPQHKSIPFGIKAGKSCGADLGCIDGPDFVKRIDFNKTIKWLAEELIFYKSQVIFVAGGDVVGNAQATLDSYAEFYRYFKGWPVAYVAQNGAELLPIPDNCSCVFIGGMPMLDRPLKEDKNGKITYMDWKDSPEAESVIDRAMEMGKHIHIGRVNTERRFDIFNVMDGSENFTFDGTRMRWDGTKKVIDLWQSWQSKPIQKRLFTNVAF